MFGKRPPAERAKSKQTKETKRREKWFGAASPDRRSNSRSLRLLILGPGAGAGSTSPAIPAAPPVSGAPIALIVVGNVAAVYPTVPAAAATSAIVVLRASLLAQDEFLRCRRGEG